KPVILTGSQLPFGVARTDGRENLISSVEIAAAKDEEGHAMVPEVCIFFHNQLMRGNRSSKTSADDFTAFRSSNFPPLAETGVSIKYHRGLILKPSDWNAPLKVNTELDTRVSILKIHPGITPGVVRDILHGNDTKAVILETYGAGNAPSKRWFLYTVREAAEMGKILVNVTQCPRGAVNMDIYANGRALKEAGVLSGYDSTTESALAKLFCLLGQNLSSEQVKMKVVENLRGEISK
ncbi:MAG: asparaginase domain-containing protein, partial [Bacteroidales bacterium]|nr:asparaginase domain-containing protein [Bacteroidales bacterium]